MSWKVSKIIAYNEDTLLFTLTDSNDTWDCCLTIKTIAVELIECNLELKTILNVQQKTKTNVSEIPHFKVLYFARTDGWSFEESILEDTQIKWKMQLAPFDKEFGMLKTVVYLHSTNSPFPLPTHLIKWKKWDT